MKWEEQYEKSKKFNVYETGLGDFKKEIKKKNRMKYDARGDLSERPLPSAQSGN